MPDVIPMLAYENGVSALDWLAQAFGFRECRRILGQDGRLSHGEMEAGDGRIILASPTPDYQSPKHHRQTCEAANRWSQVAWVIDGVLVYVGDIEGHLARAKRAGAFILSGIEGDPPMRHYRAEDLEGHRWMFMQRED